MSVNDLNCEVRGEMTVSAGITFQLIILQQTKTVPYYSYDKPDIKLANRIVLHNQKFFCIPESWFHYMRRKNKERNQSWASNHVTSKPKASVRINIHVLQVHSDHCMQTTFYNNRSTVSSNFVSHLTQNYIEDITWPRWDTKFVC